MSSPAPLAPLETLLLLQGFQTSQPGSSLDTLSDSLKARHSNYGRGSPDVDRFEPNSLELLYLRLLKEEAKLESQKDIGVSHAQDEQQESCQRKLSSPPLETLEEALHYRHLIPQLATRVYDNHRDSAIKAIEDEERKYRSIERDIQEIERGEWDARLQSQDATSKRDSKSISSIQTLLQDVSTPNYPAPKPVNGLSSTPPLPKPVIQRSPPNVSFIKSQSQASPYANGDSDTTTSAVPTSLPQDPATSAAASPKRPQPILYPPQQLPSKATRPPSQSTSAETGAPFLPPIQQNQQGYGITSPPPDLHRRHSSQPANITPSPSTRPPQTPLQPPEHSSGSPIILPPPPGMLRKNSSASGPLDPLADMTGHQYRANAMPSPRPPPSSGGPQHPVQLPLPPNYAHNPYQYPSYDNRPPYSNNYAPYPSSPLPAYQAQNHPQVPSYQHPTHHPGQQPHYPSRQPYQSPVQTYPQYSHYGSAPVYTPQGQMASPYPHYPPPRPIAPQTPVYASDSHRKPPRPSPINTSVSSTKWKNAQLPAGVASPKSPIPPGPEAISPISEKAPSPVLQPAQIRSKGVRSQEEPSSSATKDPPSTSNHPSTVKRGRGRPRGSTSRGRGGRAASIASSALQAPSRSPSLTSGADELAFGLSTTAGNRPAFIKPEPPATPARDSSASIPPLALTDEGNRKSTRQRRGTLRGQELNAETTRTSTKRKRTVDTSELDSRPTVSSELEKQREELSATHILASRNFPRTSATLMNDITAHKLASIFAKPITERDAPGYDSLIYRPQDLKSIKQAITIGNRALTAFIDQERQDDDETSRDIIPIVGAGEADARVWVRKNEDFMPPKGIINSVQLEKELMRVFANAVMFNPDPKRSLGPAFRTRAKLKERHIPVHLDDRMDEDDEEEEDAVTEGEGGVVKDAREMFDDVERVVGQWRAAERAAEEAALLTGSGKMGKMRGGDGEEEEVDELAEEGSTAAVEEEACEERAGKRRRR
ncbi:MAG: hypothetical protein Q9166_000193 [cf. Caloplaca sp. 2 TL-2023]